MMPRARTGRGYEVRGWQGPCMCNISGEQMMRGLSSGGERLASWALTGLVCTALTSAAAQHRAPAPDFSSNQVGWIATNPDFIAVPGGPSPTRGDPAHPYVPNNAGAQPTFRVADLANPNIKPWAKEVMRRENERVLAGGIGFTPRSSCMPAGVPAFMLFPVVEPIFFVQSPKVVLMIFAGDAQIRHIYLDVPHSAHLKQSWYGESVGYYEGD